MRLVSDNKFPVYLIGSLLDSIFALVHAEVKTLLISKKFCSISYNLCCSLLIIF